jgi:hypothetical protein
VRTATRCLIVAITICAWIGISNHCAFRALGTKTASAQNECPFHSKPAKPQSQSSGVECCKILRALATAPAKNLAPAVVDFAFAELVVLSPPKISFAPLTLDTGPPGTTSFVELIGSMRPHAPPFVG